MRNALSYQHLRLHIKQEIQKDAHSASHADQYAWWLLCAATGQSRTAVMRDNTTPVQPHVQAWIEQALHRLLTHHEPIQYIIGNVPFLHLTIAVEPPILIPRPETEEWVQELIDSYRSQGITPRHILDLCTGSGCIALALAAAFPQAQVIGIDINPQAVTLAQKNTVHNNLHNVSFVQSDLYNTLVPMHQFDLIVANPPYIDPALWSTIEPTVRLWEDRNALVAEERGLALIAQIVAQAPSFLSPATEDLLPQLWIEIDPPQSALVSQLFEQQHFSDITITVDIAGRHRVIHGSMKTV